MAFLRGTIGTHFMSTPGLLDTEAAPLPSSTGVTVDAGATIDLSGGSFDQIFGDYLTADSLSQYDRFLANQEDAANALAPAASGANPGSYGLIDRPSFSPAAYQTHTVPKELVFASPALTSTPSSITGTLYSGVSTGSQDSANSAIALGSDVATSLYGVTGAGEKIGIISDSYNDKGGANADIAAGRLPGNVTVLSDQAGQDEGRSMVEDAYSIAPGAQYYFADDGQSEADFATAVTALKNAGCTVIIDDVAYYDEPLYQSGSVADKAITSAIGSGVNYFTSAGNEGDNYIEQGFKPLAVNIPGIGAVTANDFGGGSPYLNIIIPSGDAVNDGLGWAQPSENVSGGAGAQNSLAIYLLDSQGNVVASTTTNQVGGNASQHLYYVNETGSSSFRIVVTQNGGVVPAGQLLKIIQFYGGTPFVDATGNPIGGTGSGDLIGHEFLAGVNAVGAVDARYTPSLGTSPATVETYSSQGPGEVLYDANGNLLTTPIVPNDPEFAAPDGTDFHTTNGIQTFDGTSAAAPAAGAVAALVLSANSALSTKEITSILEQSTIPTDQSAAGGPGFIQARAAVEIGAADAGDRWNHASGGDWATGSNWSQNAAPTAAEGVSLSDDLGTITGSYQATVDTLGQVAGSVAISAPAGSSATLNVTTGGHLTVGGPSAANPTAGDLLTSDNGTLKVSGGTLTVSGSINNNNGTVTVSSGMVTADNVAQNSGQFSIGGGASPAVMTLNGGGFNLTGGTALVLALGDLVTTSVQNVDATITIAGIFNDEGSVGPAGIDSFGTIDLQSGGQLTIGASVTDELIQFQGGGLLDLATTDAATLTSGLDDAEISGLGFNDGAVDFSGLSYNAADTLTYSASSGLVDIFNSVGSEIASVDLDIGGNYSGLLKLQSDGLTDHLELVALCFCAGTMIATERGEVAIEKLNIGDHVLTSDGEREPVRWIGLRSYLGEFVQSDPFVLPVCVKAGALGESVPTKDLWVSPGHALHIDGQLVAAWRLINGVSVIQATSVETLAYYHVELDRHAVLLANGAPAESFVDDGCRHQFHNASAYHARYPNAPMILPMAPRLETGFALQAIQRQVNARAGLEATDRLLGPLRGFIDDGASGHLCGWAQDMANPEEPVHLEVLIDGRPVLCILANGYRADLRSASLGSGCHAFDVTLAASLCGFGEIDVRRVPDGARLSTTDDARFSRLAA